MLSIVVCVFKLKGRLLIMGGDFLTFTERYLMGFVSDDIATLN